jgi:hypothetical protein
MATKSRTGSQSGTSNQLSLFSEVTDAELGDNLVEECVCQLDLAHFDALIWPPASLPLLRSLPVIN